MIERTAAIHFLDHISTREARRVGKDTEEARIIEVSDNYEDERNDRAYDSVVEWSFKVEDVNGDVSYTGDLDRYRLREKFWKTVRELGRKYSGISDPDDMDHSDHIYEVGMDAVKEIAERAKNSKRYHGLSSAFAHLLEAQQQEVLAVDFFIEESQDPTDTPIRKILKGINDPILPQGELETQEAGEVYVAPAAAVGD